MRKILLPFALMGTLSLPMIACDVEDGADGSDVTQPDGDTSGDTDTVVTTKYFAVIVTDSQIFPTHRVVGTNPCACLLYTSPSPRDRTRSRMPSSA